MTRVITLPDHDSDTSFALIGLALALGPQISRGQGPTATPTLGVHLTLRWHRCSLHRAGRCPGAVAPPNPLIDRSLVCNRAKTTHPPRPRTPQDHAPIPGRFARKALRASLPVPGGCVRPHADDTWASSARGDGGGAAGKKVVLAMAGAGGGDGA
eukprot:2477864-Prymnesium_polylepis.1